MTPEEFTARLEKGIPPVTVLAGEENFFKEELVDAVRAALEKASPGARFVSFERRSGEKDEAAARRLLVEFSTPVLFGPLSLMVVREGDGLLPVIRKQLLPFLEEGARPPPNRIVFFARSVDGRTRFAKRLKASGALVDCRKLYAAPGWWQRGGPEDSELARWARGRAKGLGLDLSPQAAAFLAAQTGDDLFRLRDELEKLCLVLPEKKGTVGIEEIERTTGTSAVHTPFDLWEKIEAGDRKGALETLSVILRNGLRSQGGRLETDAVAIAAVLLGILRERIRLAARVGLLQWEGRDDREIMKQLKINSSFYLRKLKATAARLDARRVGRVARAIHGAERAVKREGLKPVPVLESLVVRLAEGGP